MPNSASVISADEKAQIDAYLDADRLEFQLLQEQNARLIALVAMLRTELHHYHSMFNFSSSVTRSLQ